MGERHSLRDFEFLNNVPDKFLKCERISYPWYATKFTPKFNGITPHVTLVAEMEGLGRKFDALRADITIKLEDMMDERGVGVSEYHTNKVLEAIEDSHSRIEYLAYIASSSNGALVSDSDGEDIFHFCDYNTRKLL